MRNIIVQHLFLIQLNHRLLNAYYLERKLLETLGDNKSILDAQKLLWENRQLQK